MTEYFDALETRSPQQRIAALAEQLPAQIARAKNNTPYFAQALADIDPARMDSVAALAGLPVLRKSDLIARQQQHPPFGGLTAAVDLTRVLQSPGPIREPQGRQPEFWRFARACHAAGFRAGGLVHNTFAYHFTPAGFMFDAAAAALGCTVFP